MAQGLGVEVRTSRPATWTQCRQRGGAVVAGSLVMMDLGGSDALTAEYSTSSNGAAPGTQSTASGPLATVLEATDGLTSGRVGVVMGAAVKDDGLGLYELGEVGGGVIAPVIIERSLVLVDGDSIAGAPVQVGASDGTACFAPVTDGTPYGILLQDCTTDAGNGPTAALNYRAVMLYTEGLGSASGGGLTEEQEEILASALVYDDEPWDVGTEYAPNTIVKIEGSDTLYLQGDTVASTGDDPEDGAPWEVWGSAEAEVAAPQDQYFIRDMFTNTSSTLFTGTAMTSGTVSASSGFGATGLAGVVSMTSSGAAGSGYRFQTVGGTGFEAIAGLLWTGRFMVPTNHTDKTLRFGFMDANSTAAPTDGVYTEVVAGTATVYSVSAGTPTANASTFAMAADVWYDASVYWTTTGSVVVSMRATGGAMLDTRTITADLPSGTQQFGAGFMCWTPVGAAGVVAQIDDMGYGIVAAHTP